MRVQVRVEAPIRHWHVQLLQRLSERSDDRVTVTVTDAVPSRGSNDLDRLLAFERQLFHVSNGLGRRVRASAIEPWSRSDQATLPEPDLILDLTESVDSGPWSVRFDGLAGEAAAFAALRAGRCPMVTVVDGEGINQAVGRPGSESPGVMAAAFDDLLAGCVTLIVGAIQASPFAAPVATNPPADPHAASSSRPSLLRYAVRQSVGAVLRRGYRTLYRAPHWRVGWRWTDERETLLEPDRLPGGWTDLPDDGLHFYADPFPFEHEGRHYLFVEDFEHRIGRGVIAMTEFDDDGPVHPPEPVLSHRVHLSYPHLIGDDGQVWMIPETSGAGTVELYRAVDFPRRWVLERVLLQGVEASDTTVFRHGDRWWMTATVRDQGSFSDALHLWHADRLTGPWKPHRDNPVLVDICSARPAGHVVRDGHRLIRPTQDGRTGYGAALAITEITALDEERFEQRLIRRLEPGPWWPGRRIHTINRAGRLECVDGSAMSPRFRRPLRATNRTASR